MRLFLPQPKQITVKALGPGQVAEQVKFVKLSTSNRCQFKDTKILHSLVEMVFLNVL